MVLSRCTSRDYGAPNGGDGIAPRFDILIADDNAGLTRSLRDILKVQGYNAAIAHNGQAALTQYLLTCPSIASPSASQATLHLWFFCELLPTFCDTFVI